MAQHGRYAYQQELQRFDLPDSIFQLEINYLWCNVIFTLVGVLVRQEIF